MATPAADPRTPDPWEGHVLGGHYELRARSGAGAMGVVYRARHTLSGEEVAVKVLHEDLASDPDLRRRLLREARVLAAFAHRNAVPVRHVGEEDGRLFLVMGWVDGEPLAACLAREGALAPERAVLLTLQALDALEEAHLAGVVHRDLKPSNLMVEHGAAGEPERIRLVDFGLAHLAERARGTLPPALASAGPRVVGTVAYMAPEQVRGEDVDARSDLFALGAVLREMLDGARAFPGEEPLAVAAAVLAGAPTPWGEEALRRVPPALREVVERALAVDPEARYQSAGQMADALRAALGAAGAPVRRRRPALRAGAVGLVAALAAGLLLTGGGPGASPSAPPAEHAGPTAVHEAAARALGAERFAEAAQRWSEVLAASPGDLGALLGRAAARRAAGEPGADADLTEALRRHPGEPAALVARARSLARDEGQTAEALRLLGQALLLDPPPLEARALRVEVSITRRDLAGAEADVLALERAAAGRLPALLARARFERARANQRPEELDDVALARGEEAARAATALDPRDAEASAVLAGLLQDRGTAARQRGDDAAAEATLRAAVAAADEALRRAAEHPGHRLQGGERVDLRIHRAGVHFVRSDPAAALGDLDAAVAAAPRHVLALGTRAFALQALGRDEDALADHQRLYDVTRARDPLFRVGFGWQALGMRAAERGDDAAARLHLERALATYAQGRERFPEAQEMLVYRAETLTRRARLRLPGPERDADLAAAAADLEGVLRAHPGDAETLLRAAERALAAGDAEAALAAARAAVGARRDRTPRYYLTLVDALLAGPAPLPAAHVGEALEALERARALAPGAPHAALAAAVEVRLAAGDAAAARRALDDLRRAPPSAEAEAGEAARQQAVVLHLEGRIALAEGRTEEACASLGAAVAQRAVEHAAGRWRLEPRWYERWAEALDAWGRRDAAATARTRAAALPR